MKTPDTAKSKAKSGRKSRPTVTTTKEDVPLELVKTKWAEILEEEDVSSAIDVTRAVSSSKMSLSLDVSKAPVIKVAFNEDELPIDLNFEGPLTEREVFKSICNLFSALSTVTVLRMVDCKLRAEAIVVLGNSLAECGAIKELYLDLNPVDGEDYSPLLINSTLDLLSLKGCAISGRGAELISEKLANNNIPLKVLNLNTNLIDDQGAIAISRNLKWCNKLSCLSLAGNIIGSPGAISIISALKEFTLDAFDIKKRKAVLFERAKLILNIVNDREESYVATLPPMPALISPDFPSGRKSRQKDLKVRRNSKSQKAITSSGKVTTNEDKHRTSMAKKDKSKLSDQFSRSHISIKQPRSSVTTHSMTESITPEVVSRVEPEGDTDTLEFSDDDSISDFSRFDSYLVEDWDRKDNERRYKEKMMKKLCQDVCNELYQDPAFQDTVLSRVFTNNYGKLCSKGNLELKSLNLAHNKIQQNVMDSVMAMINYQEKACLTLGLRKGLRILVLEGNPIPPQQLLELENYLRPPFSDTTPSTATSAY